MKNDDENDEWNELESMSKPRWLHFTQTQLLIHLIGGIRMRSLFGDRLKGKLLAQTKSTGAGICSIENWFKLKCPNRNHVEYHRSSWVLTKWLISYECGYLNKTFQHPHSKPVQRIWRRDVEDQELKWPRTLIVSLPIAYWVTVFFAALSLSLLSLLSLFSIRNPDSVTKTAAILEAKKMPSSASLADMITR